MSAVSTLARESLVGLPLPLLVTLTIAVVALVCLGVAVRRFRLAGTLTVANASTSSPSSRTSAWKSASRRKRRWHTCSVLRRCAKSGRSAGVKRHVEDISENLKLLGSYSDYSMLAVPTRI